MLVKTRSAFALTLFLTYTAAGATPGALDKTALDKTALDTTALEVPGPSLVILETSVDTALRLRTPLRLVVLEASPSHLVLAVTEPGVLWIDNAADGELVATVTRVEAKGPVRLEGGAGALATSFYTTADRRPLFTLVVARRASGATVTPVEAVVSVKEEYHEIDPDPHNARTAWAGDWALASAAVAQLGPGWYFVVRDGEVSYEVVFEGR